MRYRRRRPPDREPLTPRQAQILAGWVLMLDVDLDLAQATFREYSDRTLPLPPIELPALVVAGEVRAPAVEAPSAPEAPPPSGRQLRGAYARRAAAKTAPHGSVTPVSNPSDSQEP